MSDFAITALSSAGLTIVVAIVVAVLSLKLSSAKDDVARYSTMLTRAQADGEAKDLALKSLTSDLKTANSRLEALDAENRKLRAAQPVAGSFDRLFPSEATTSGPGGGQGVVPGGSATKAPDASGADALLKPGE